jgi:hypothetical protein
MAVDMCRQHMSARQAGQQQISQADHRRGRARQAPVVEADVYARAIGWLPEAEATRDQTPRGYEDSCPPGLPQPTASPTGSPVQRQILCLARVMRTCDRWSLRLEHSNLEVSNRTEVLRVAGVERPTVLGSRGSDEGIARPQAVREGVLFEVHRRKGLDCAWPITTAPFSSVAGSDNALKVGSGVGRGRLASGTPCLANSSTALTGNWLSANGTPVPRKPVNAGRAAHRMGGGGPAGLPRRGSSLGS